MMKPKLKLAACSLFALYFGFSFCNKKDDDFPIEPPVPAKATINFNIKDSSMLDWGEPVYLSHLLFISNSNVYDPGENIFLRSTIDTTFSFKVQGNANNFFTIGGAPFDGVLIYNEQKFI